MRLPSLPNSGRYYTETQTEFRGLNANPGAEDGEIVSMTNMTGRYYPVMATRERRRLYRTLVDTPDTLFSDDAVVWVDGSYLYVDGTPIDLLNDTPGKQIARMLRKIVIFPDKKIYDMDAGTLTSMESSVSLYGVDFQNGTIFGESAEANTLYKSGAAWGTHFKEGDAVTISGVVTHPENNQTFIIREIDGDYLRFYEYSFTLDPLWSYTPGANDLAAGTYYFTAGADTLHFTLSEVLPTGGKLEWDGSTLTRTVRGIMTPVSTSSGIDGSRITMQESATRPYTELATLTFARTVPDMDFICVNENRLWGCKGDTIYASKLGDPTNFNVFDGLSTDSWESQVGDRGDFTGCVSYLGYPMFFKEESVFKVYGDKPSNFQWTPSARFGVAAGSEKSLAVANETLYYLSPTGIVAYTGGIPTVISEPLGVDKRWRNAVAGSDGLRYYVSMQDGNGFWGLYVYDTQRGMWHREDATHAVGFGYWSRALHVLSIDKNLWTLDGSSGATQESAVNWTAEFADCTMRSPLKKGVLRVLLRCELDAGASLTVSIRYDGGTYGAVKTVTATAKQSYVLPLIVRRCDHWNLKLNGTGGCKVYSIAQTRYVGSEKQGAAYGGV